MNRTIVATISVLLIGLWLEANADDSIIGKKYWHADCASSAEQRRCESEWTKITGRWGESLYYEVERSDGTKDTVWGPFLEKAIEEKGLVDYDPRAKRREQVAKAKAARLKTIKAKKWPKEIEDAVINRQIKVGMTKEQIIMALGNPERINKSGGAWGIHEQWVYTYGRIRSVYIYFDNGRMTGFQNNRG